MIIHLLLVAVHITQINTKTNMIKGNLSIFAFLALAVFATGCLADVDVADVEHNADDAWKVDPSLPVPIEFAIPSTKGLIDGLDDMTSLNGNIGMFAIAKDETDLTKTDQELNIRNRYCSFVNGKLAFGYASSPTVLYYPSSDRCYNFYSYFKHKDPIILEDDLAEMTSSERRILVSIELANSNDVLYAKAEVSDDDVIASGGIDGFNSKYIRRTGKLPSLNYVHPAAGLGFRVMMSQESDIPQDSDFIQFTSLSFDDATLRAALCIVDLDQPQNNGTFVESIETGPKTISSKLVYLSDKEVFDGITGITTSLKSLGNECFIMPQNEPLNMTATIHRYVKYVRQDGTIATSGLYTYPVSFVLDPTEAGLSGGFEAGKMYRYKLIVKYVAPTGGDKKGNVIVTAEPDIV